MPVAAAAVPGVCEVELVASTAGAGSPPGPCCIAVCSAGGPRPVELQPASGMACDG
jgi:hypothetical protein